MKTIHAMGSGAGLAAGFGQLERFGLSQPVLAVCGDSTFYHAAMPALVNARYNGSNFVLLLLDNSATAMTGFQPHPGTGRTATGKEAPVLDLKVICESLGARVQVTDPFDLAATTDAMLKFLQDREGVKVLILKRECALVRSKKQKKLYQVEVNQERCLGETCGCNRLCTRVFKCPGFTGTGQQGRPALMRRSAQGAGSVLKSVLPPPSERR